MMTIDYKRLKNVFLCLFFFIIIIPVFGVPVFAADITYNYDDLNRLIKAEYDDGGYTEYVYDNIDNRTKKTCNDTVLAGDTDANRAVELKDIILDLRIVSGINPGIYIHKESSVTENGIIGLEEAVYGLQAVSESR